MSLPRNETKRSDEMSDTPVSSSSGDLIVNNLVYKQPQALSLAVNRTYQRQWFQRDSYSAGSTAICDINSGTAYVNPENSYLTFTVNLTGTTPSANFGSHCALALLREIKIRSRSGTELDRVEKLNLWSKFDMVWSLPDSYLKKFGRAMGFGDARVGATDAASITDTSNTRVCIPLKFLCGFFRPLKKQLIPASLMSGLHIEIVFDDHRTALFSKGGTITGYTVSDIQFMLDSVELTDDVQKTLNLEASQSGLEYAYPRVHTAITQHPSNQTSASIQIRKAVSQATLVYTVVQAQADILDITKDSFLAVNHDTTSWGYRLGSLYFPHQAVSDSGANGVESYVIAQQMWDKLRHPFAESSVSPVDFRTGGLAILSASLEKDCNLNLSGLPINNSRTLELNCTFSSVPAARELVSFVEYVAVSKSYIDNTAVAL